ncbi:T9SS type A sorting domain-containing protein [Ekhidna sp.]|uniref:T9SS type A sorting domain-containing protein n=1 Tax=Ekhidna sp. TaxID=2608089 RepID=UPI003B59638D
MRKFIFVLIASFASSLAFGAFPEIVQRIDRQRLLDGFSPYSIDLSEVFSDPDGQVLTYQVERGWDEVITVAIEGDQMTISPTTGLGVAKVTVKATDPDEESSQFSFIVQVTEPDNQDPVLDSAILNVTAYYNDMMGDFSFYAEVDVDQNFSDPDGDNLTFNGDTDLKSAVITVVDGSLRIASSSGGGGVFDIFVRALDGKGGVAVDTFFIHTYSDFDGPFVLNPLPPQYLQKGFESEEIDISRVMFLGSLEVLEEVSASAADESIVKASSTYMYHPTTVVVEEEGAGETEVTIKYQFTSFAIEHTFSVVINAPPTLVSSIENLSFVEGFGTASVDFQSAFTDEDEDELVFAAESSNEAAVEVSIAEGQLLITEMGLGESTIEITATDGKGGELVVDFVVSVTEPPLAVNNGLNDVHVFPNPFSDRVNIKGFPEGFQFSVYATDGREYYSQNSQSGRSIDLSPLATGQYFMRITNGRQTKTIKLVKSN